MTPPCKDCPVRHEACHDTCERFAAWRTWHKADAAYNHRMLDRGTVYHANHEDRHRQRSRKRRFGKNGGADR